MTSSKHQISFLRIVQLFTLLLFTHKTVLAKDSLATVFELARKNDPSFLSAAAQVDLSTAREQQALGSLLPQLTASGSTNKNKRSYTILDSPLPKAPSQSYGSSTWQINITQPIFHYASIVNWQQSELQKEQAMYLFSNAEQELAINIIIVWFDIMAARDNVTFSQQQLKTTKLLLEKVKRGQNQGLSSEPQYLETFAKNETANSDLISAEEDLQIKIAALEKLTGPLNDFIPPDLRQELTLPDLSTLQTSKIIDEIFSKNPSILAAQKALEAANAEINKQFSGHFPTLEIVANYSDKLQNAGDYPQQSGYKDKSAYIGLQLSVPIFTGGTQQGKVNEAIAQRDKAAYELESAKRTAAQLLKQAWHGWKSAFSKEKSNQHSINSALAAKTLAQRGIDTGLSSQIETLQAEQQYATAKKDWNKNVYDQITSYIKIKSLTGEISTTDITSLDQFFIENQSQLTRKENTSFTAGKIFYD
ncbi:TolC family protein [Iodobacter sp. CM08]|uniref:TolC family protein n=1 Tax=Iodobacter sp. CM08 TaxID=3085902 RepID=UPI002980C23E|nr:TolC family protein [Iodobacter sp. CM08]MDW5418651.1 TolC family protein [Iodobacter sp. CM08]